MEAHIHKFVYPPQYHLILRNSENEEEFYALADGEVTRFRVLQRKFNFRHHFHIVPDYIMVNLHKFDYYPAEQCFKLNMNETISVQLNKLEEYILEHKKEEARK